MREEKISHNEFSKVVQLLLCLPGTNACVEGVFSIMNKIWTDEKSQLSVKALKSKLIVKTNLRYTCLVS